MRTVKIIQIDIDKALQKYVEHQNNCEICQHKPHDSFDEINCFEADWLYEEYENLRSEKDYAEQVFQLELKDRNIN